MGVCIKFASSTFGVFEIVAYRGLFGVVFVAVWVRWRGVSLRTTVAPMHAWRGVVGVVSLVTWFYAIGQLPLATAMTLNYMSSMWVAACVLGGWLLVRPRQLTWRQGPLLLTIGLGFTGVAMVLQPTLVAQQFWAGVSGLISGLFAALAYLQVAALSRAGEPETRTVFYFSITALATGVVGMLWVGVTPLWQSAAWWLLPIGLFAVLGQLCMTRAYASGATLVVANLQYFGIAFAALYGIVIFQDQLGVWGWSGMALIVASGMLATALRHRTVPQHPAKEYP